VDLRRRTRGHCRCPSPAQMSPNLWLSPISTSPKSISLLQNFAWWISVLSRRNTV
jgi:hypothetical protein